MEDIGILTSESGVPRPMRFKLVLIWLAMTGAFAGYGFVGPGLSGQISGDVFNARTAFEEITLFGALGVGVATCTTIGLLIISKVRARSMSKGLAILSLAISSVGSMILTLLLLRLARALSPWDILGGERGMAIAFVMVWMVLVAAAAFVTFSICVLLTRKRTMAEGMTSYEG